MKHTLLVLLIGSYLLAFWINFMPALKHPDLNANLIGLFATIFYMFVLLVIAVKGPTTKKLVIFSALGILSGALVFLLDMVENITLQYAILDSLASIKYPFYLIFTTSLFGTNMLFNLSHTTLSLLMSVFYLLVFVLAVRKKKS